MVKSQKRILCVHDLAGVGRCSLCVILPILNVMGHETCPLPTSVLSSHTGGFGTPATQDMTLHCVNSLAHYNSLDIVFDCVYSGYVSNEAQLALTLTVLSHRKNALFVLDPVMGDNGQMYKSLSATLPAAMSSCAKNADIITPNVTESALLLGLNPSEGLSCEREVEHRLNQLSEICGGDIVITGVCLENEGYFNAVRNRMGEIELLPYVHKGKAYPGTGDIFAAIVCGRTLLGDNIFLSVKKASAFVQACAAQAEIDGTSSEYGVPFEKLLRTLI